MTSNPFGKIWIHDLKVKVESVQSLRCINPKHQALLLLQLVTILPRDETLVGTWEGGGQGAT